MITPNEITTRNPSTAVGIGHTGAIAFANVADVIEVARLMSKSQTAVPKHLRDNPGACLGVALTASEWQMSPFAVANKSYVVNDRIAYEAQMINAVILRRAPIKGRMRFSYSGEGEKRRCKVCVTCNDGEEVSYESPELGKIPVKNSPLWKGDPDQQLAYYSSRAMCRRHFPDVILGVYTADEIEEERDVTPSIDRSAAPKFIPETTPEDDVDLTAPPQDVIQEPEPESETPKPSADAPNGPESQSPSAESVLQSVKDAMESDSVRGAEVVAFLFANGKVASDKLALKSCPEDALAFALSNWKEVVESTLKK